MKSFAIDIYLWYEEAGLWMLVPPYPSQLEWSANLLQSEILTCEAGITFRIDEILWLGNERDMFPLEVVVFDLETTLSSSDQSKELLARLRVNEFLSIEIKKNSNQKILLSRLSTQKDRDYLEQVANFVGTYYEDFAVDKQMWKNSVNMSLDGLALLFGKSKNDVCLQDDPLAKWLLKRFEKLIH